MKISELALSDEFVLSSFAQGCVLIGGDRDGSLKITMFYYSFVWWGREGRRKHERE